MEQRMGRPPKATSEQKIAIIDRYFITSTDGDASQIRKHGIFRRLSEFSKTLNFSLEPHDFSRDDTVRKHIDQLASTFLQETQCSVGVPTYEPLDITALMMRGRADIERVIRDREVYFEALHIKAAKAIENYAFVSQQCTHYQAEVKSLKKQNMQMQERMETLLVELQKALKDTSYLKRIIRKNVEPERAQQFFTGLTSREVIVQNVEPSVMNSIHALSRDDRQMKAEAQAEIDVMDLNSLFR